MPHIDVMIIETLATGEIQTVELDFESLNEYREQMMAEDEHSKQRLRNGEIKSYSYLQCINGSRFI
jgi:hypothetical protein